MLRSYKRIALIPALFVFVACTTLDVRQRNPTSAPIAASRLATGQAVAILTFAPVEASLETEAVDCVSQSLKAIFPAVRIITAEEFRRTIFAYVLPDDEAERARYIALLLNQPVLRQQIEALRIRYFVLLHGKTDTKGKGGFVGLGPLGVGPPVGVFIIDRKSDLTATIVDVASASAVNELTSTSSGTAWLIFPVIGMPARTETLTCQSIGAAVANYLRDGSNENTADETKRPTE